MMNEMDGVLKSADDNCFGAKYVCELMLIGVLANIILFLPEAITK